MIRTWPLFILVAVLCMACASSRNAKLGRTYRTDEAPFTINAMRLADSSLKLTFVGPARLRTPDPIIRWVQTAIGTSENDLSETLVFTTAQSGAPGVDRTVHLVGYTTWSSKKAKTASTIVCDVSVQTSTDEVIFRQVIPITAARPISLEGFTQLTSDSTMDIGATVRRIFLPTGEFLPTAETIRVLISDENGQVIWRSDVGKVFQQRVGLVQPQRLDEVQRMAISWDGTDMQGLKVPTGKYTAEVIIPAKPTAYTTSFAFSWVLK